MRRLRTVADALARHDRRPAVLEQVDRRRADAAARRRAAEHRPSRCPARRGSAARFVPKNADAPFLSTTSRPRAARGAGRSRPSGRRPRGRRAPAPSAARGRRPSAYGSKPIVVKITGSPFARAASSSRRVASTSAVRSEPSVHSGSVKPQREVDDEHGRPLAQRHRLAEPPPRRPGVPPRRSCRHRRPRRQLLAEPRPLDELAGAGLRRRARRSRRSPGRARARPRARRSTSVPSKRL